MSSQHLLHLLIGQIGEKIAEEYLKIAGFRIIGRNWRQKIGEIDLLALLQDNKNLNKVNISQKFHVKHFSDNVLEMEGLFTLNKNFKSVKFIKNKLSNNCLNKKSHFKMSFILKMSYKMLYILLYLLKNSIYLLAKIKNIIRHLFDKYVKLLGYDKDQLVFVEVKTIFSYKDDFGFNPEDNLTYFKKEKLLRIAKFYLAAKKLPLDINWRFDLIAIIMYDNNKFNLKHY